MTSTTLWAPDSTFNTRFNSFIDELNGYQQLTIFLCGNPERADDGVGYHLYNSLTTIINTLNNNNIDIIYDLQWQLEDALSLAPDRLAIFIDSAVNQESVMQLTKITDADEFTPFSHSLNPAQLINVCEQISQQRPTHVWQLTVAGYEFELGKQITKQCLQTTERLTELLLDTILNWQRKLEQVGG